MNDHQKKFQTFLLNKINSKNKPNILEFGVREGYSTEQFIDLVEKNEGHLTSVDIQNYKNLFKSERWQFIHSRDDNFNLVASNIKDKLDVILIDSFHEANHVIKIINLYYQYLKVGGYIFIDDISWLPYLKNKKRNSFYCEINNMETFEKILNLYNSNYENFELEYTFVSSGFASIKKLNDHKLLELKEIPSRKFSIRNIFRKIKHLIKLEKQN